MKFGVFIDLKWKQLVSWDVTKSNLLDINVKYNTAQK